MCCQRQWRPHRSQAWPNLFFYTFWLSLWIYGLYGFVLVFDSASKSKSTSFHIAPVAFFVLSVRLCSLIKPLRCDPIPADIYPFTQIYLYISLARWGQWTGKARRVALHWKLDTKCQNKFFHSKWKWKPSLESRWSGYKMLFHESAFFREFRSQAFWLCSPFW